MVVIMNNPPAFPTGTGVTPYNPGMTLRDFFAAQALQGMFCNDTSFAAKAMQGMFCNDTSFATKAMQGMFCNDTSFAAKAMQGMFCNDTSFATKAMQGMFCNDTSLATQWQGQVARDAYAMADAMLKARELQTTGENHV